MVCGCGRGEILRFAQNDGGAVQNDRWWAMKRGFVYIMTNRSRTLYIGVTSDLERRVHQHKQKEIPGFTKRYNMTRLAYYEEIPSIGDAIAREKQLKGWLRSRKIALIESMNPQWRDLSEEWYATVKRNGTDTERASSC